jgi:hypothetical protein
MMFGQAASVSQIRGVIQDSTGASIPGAEVKATHTETGAIRTVTSDAAGNYVLPNLPIGSYQLAVTKDGFSRYVQTGIVLQVDVNPTIDVALKIGALSEEVSVQANAAMVETQATGLGQVVDQARVVDIPLNGRLPTDLIFLTPGVVIGRSFRASYPTSAVISIGGGINGSVGYALDGGAHNDGLSNQNLPLPFPDALQEFRVETNALPAQYGYYASGSVNAVTKSGTNTIHGDLFEFLRNGDLNARNTFAPLRDTLKRNQYGGTVGGPIKKDKLFIFGGYQGTLQRSYPTAAPAFVPTAAMLSGNFSACPSEAPKTVPAGATISPIALKVASLLPTGAGPCGQATYQLASSTYNEYQGIVKVDYQLSDKHTVFARYFLSRYDQPPGANLANNILVADQIGALDQAQSLTLGDTYVLTPTTVNSFRITGTKSTNTTVVNNYANLTSLGIGGIYQQPLKPGLSTAYISSFAVTSGFTISSTPAVQPYTTLAFSDDVNLQRGAHQISLGMNFMNVRAFAINYLNSNGNVTFNGTAPGGTGSPMGDFLYGYAASFTQTFPSYSDQRQIVFGTYAQDSWKVSRRLTVNVGLRWDPFFAHTDPYGHADEFSLAAFEAGTRSTIYPNAPIGLLFPGDPGGPGTGLGGAKFTNNELATFSPRIGIAWDPLGDGKTSIRAGYGFFYDFPSMSFDQFGFTTPFGGSASAVGSPVINLSNPWINSPGGVSPLPGAFGTKASLFPFGGSTYVYPTNTPPTSVQQFNFSVQRQFGSDWLASASYAGNTSTHLWIDNQINGENYIPGVAGTLGAPGVGCAVGSYGGVALGKPCSTTAALNALYRRNLSILNPNQTPASNAPYNTTPYYGAVDVLYPYGTGSYNSLILSLAHRFARNFSSTTNYTWSHCISDLYTPALGYGPDDTSNPAKPRGDRGNCPSADVRQVFSESIVLTSPKFSGRALETIAGDWKLGISIKADSGYYLTVNTATDVALVGTSGIQRPNQVLSNVYLPNKGQSGWLNPAAFATPATGTFGNLGAANILGPAALNVDVSLSRIFRIKDRTQLEIRGEAFNLPNLANLYNPVVASITAPNFGVPAVPSGTAPTRNDPRIMQLALKYVF